MARWAVETTYESGSIGLVIFSAANIDEAIEYLATMREQYGHKYLANLKPLTDGAGVDELRRLFPGYLREKTSR